ncbi:matrixin family metalloprotease [Neobacillus niacini]|uniref:matrixin family metalloprotease n=1 Tax=Neobacillus niacini TaxID=86668 RepID=UPI0021CB3C9C|nr:matrixin family metalloprotease [Neobacillus niacini]MCM3763742.1 matrixin family metalloprotease [Neobacillus niacini]
MPINFRELQGQLVKHGLINTDDVRDLNHDDELPPAVIEALTDVLPKDGIVNHDRLASWKVRDLESSHIQYINDTISRPRCDVPSESMSSIQIKTYGSPGGRWQSGRLSYSINPTGCNLSAADVTATINAAFAQWQAVNSFFVFTPVPNGGNIQIRFGGTELYSRFGSQGGVLATGAYPPEGRLHFDSAEHWTREKLLSVALHEIGHILGLSHSNSRASVMYPYDLSISAIDPESANALRNLYGWRPQIQLGDRATSDRPALGTTASWNFTSSSISLHMLWKGSRDDQGIYESELVNNIWTPQKKIDGIGSSDSPALETIKLDSNSSGLFMAWKGVRDDQGLYYATKRIGGWTPQKRIAGVGSSNRPALANFGGIRMAWKGVRNDQGIYWSTFTGEGWTPQQQIRGVGTSASPALVAFRNRLYMFWKGVEGDRNVYYSWLDNGPGAIWQPQRVVAYIDNETSGGVWRNIGSSSGPSATVRGNRILLAWKGIPGDQGIYFSLYDGNEFTGQIRVNNVGTSQGPTVFDTGGFTHMAWKGIDGDNTIYWTTL